jgi:hypothetical protein
MSDKIQKKKKKKKKKKSELTWENLPTPIKRRRKYNRYRHSAKSGMFDKVVISVALIAGLFMISTRGCDKSVKSLAKFMSPDKQESTEKNQLSESKDEQ